jgi:hypothetical protein
MEAPHKLGPAGSFYSSGAPGYRSGDGVPNLGRVRWGGLFPNPYSLSFSLLHSFTSSLLFIAHFSLSIVIQITVSKNSPLFGV